MALSATQALGGLDVRLEVWSHALYMIQDFPFTGSGFGAFGEVANRLYPFYLVAPETAIPHAHNLLLQIAVDLGLLGLAAWLLAWFLACVAAWSVHRQGRAESFQPARLPEQPSGAPAEMSGAWLAGIGAGLLGSQAALAVHGLLDAVTWGARPALIVWAIWGLGIAMGSLVRPELVGERRS